MYVQWTDKTSSAFFLVFYMSKEHSLALSGVFQINLLKCFSFFFVDQTRCNVWILDGDLYHKGLLKFAMEASSLKDTLVMLVVDMSRPWTALDSLQKWASVVREHIDKLKIPPEEMKEMEQKCEYSANTWESI